MHLFVFLLETRNKRGPGSIQEIGSGEKSGQRKASEKGKERMNSGNYELNESRHVDFEKRALISSSSEEGQNSNKMAVPFHPVSTGPVLSKAVSGMLFFQSDEPDLIIE